MNRTNRLALCIAGMITVLTACASRQQLESATDRMQQMNHAMGQAQSEWRQRLSEQDRQWQEFTRLYTPAIRAELEQNLKASRQRQADLEELSRQAARELSQLRQTQQEAARLLRGIEANYKDSTVQNVVMRFEELDLKTQAALSASRTLMEQAQQASVNAESKVSQSTQQVLFAQRTVEDMRQEIVRHKAELDRARLTLQQETQRVERLMTEAKSHNDHGLMNRQLIQQVLNEQGLAKQRVELLDIRLQKLLQLQPPKP